MEENNDQLNYKFEFWCDSKKIFRLIGFFLVLFLLSIIIGALGPSPLNSKTESFKIKNGTDTSDNTFIINGLTKHNQFIFVNAYFHNSKNYGIFSEVGYETRLFGSNNLNKNLQSTNTSWEKVTSSKHTRTIECKKNANCTPTLIDFQPYVKYRNYKIETIAKTKELSYLFDLNYIECEFLNLNLVYFEIVFRYIFVLVTIFFLAYLVRVTKGIPFKNFTLPQKLISILFILLLLKNNPFYPAILLDNKNNYPKKPFIKYYLPRILPLFLMWIIIIILNFVAIADEVKDPLIIQDGDIRGFRGFHIFVDILLIGYCIWMAFAVIKTVKFLIIQLHNGNEENASTKMKSFFYILLFSYVIFFCGNIIYFKKFIPKFTSSSLEFLLIYTLDTVYVALFGVALLPISITTDLIKNSNDQLEQEEGRHKPLNQGSKNGSESELGNNQLDIINEKPNYSKKPLDYGEMSSEIEPSDLEFGNENKEKNKKPENKQTIVKQDSANDEIEKGGLLSSENSEN
ncbi:transmembrane protein [Anaeramoeba flamelloides]|uniref:Transmembrane protein n=1 Tax=Anaeramoeba flamelloides TaxID=1746091 RepID=A0ABQ8Z7R6_9EUKA|nr:transmembrane protein [Anaeramoeba flamelloides]